MVSQAVMAISESLSLLLLPYTVFENRSTILSNSKGNKDGSKHNSH